MLLLKKLRGARSLSILSERGVATNRSLTIAHGEREGEQRCWSCGALSPTLLFCKQCGRVQSLQHYSSELPSHNFFDLLTQPKKVQVNDCMLEQEFHKLQRLLHPDKFANASHTEREIATENSSIVNQAFQVLFTCSCCFAIEVYLYQIL